MFKRWGWNVACPVNLGFDGDSNGASDRRLMKWIDRYEPRLVILRCPRNVWLSQHVSEQGSSQERRRARKLKQKHYDFFKIAESVFERQVKRGDDAVLESPDQQTDQPMTQALEDTSDVEEEELLEDIPMGDSGRCTWIAYVFMTVPLKPIGEPSMYHPRVGDADSEVARRMRKITNPRVGQLVFFWRAEKKKVGDPLEGITDLPRHLAKLAGTVGWTQDELGNPVLVSYQAWAYREWVWLEKECKWLELENPHQFLPQDTCVLIRGLQGVKQGQLLRLLKPVYGRPDAPRAWYEELAKVLVHELGFIKSQIDPAVFMLRNKDGSLIGCMVVHVDDLMVCHDGSDYAVRVIDKLGKRFPFGTWENVYEKPEGVTYCGKEIKIVKDNDGEHISLSQNAFLDGRLQEMEIAKERRKSLESLATPEEMANYRSVVGSLQWLATQSRPDLCFETNQLQKRIADLRVHDLFRANKAVREADKNRMQIMFRNLGKDAQLVVYTDAGLYSSLGVEIDERECEDVLQSDRSKRLVYSQKGAVVGFVKKGSTDVRGEFSHINVLDWRSSTNKRVIESSFCAETHAALMAIGMGHFCQVLMSELRFGSDVVGSVEDDGWNDLVPMFLVTDCKSIYDTVHKDGQHVSDKSGVIQAVLLRQLLTTRDAPGKSKHRTKPIIVYSEVATPFSRCRAFCRWLLRAGHQTIKVERVRRLRGGIFGWKHKNGPVARPLQDSSYELTDSAEKDVSRLSAGRQEDMDSLDASEHGWARVRTWTRSVRRRHPAGIFACDYLFLPLHHEAERHWSLAVVCRPWAAVNIGQDVHTTTTVAFLDSLRSPSSEKHEAVVLHKLKSYLRSEWQDCTPLSTSFDEGRIQAVAIDVPQQQNSSDCGIYAWEVL
ncbi:putative ubiquitin-like-specific protease 2A [Symbiodinium microadriaticum]|uniref:Putative ubiquitin-like-specific protease 2A n=1 Tax=Symbiodinium microadriaticum TaxID=2951 RepID=A0A1Q9DK71_SYMMI|nr:putative ubiquitin-like-specific protease 2A [Symbiodinium microadriaticum]